MKTNQSRVASTFNVRSSLFNVLLTLLLLLVAAGGASAATRYVWQGSPSPGPPYTNWTTAAHVIQDAVDMAQTGDTVLVAGGVYATGGRAVYGTMTNRVAIQRAIKVESLMGPEVTIIQGRQVPGTTNGDGAVRCVYLTSGASLSGFTLTNGATRQWSAELDEREYTGGGLLCESSNAVASNCVIVGNSANYGGGLSGGRLHNCTLTCNSAEAGGGASWSTLDNCTLAGNSAYSGGGSCGGSLYNCTLNGNSAVGAYGTGGGACGSTLYNCSLTGNSANNGGGAYWGTLNDCSLTGNSASQYGGGAAGDNYYPCVLNDCTLANNSAEYGGGAYYATLNNCMLTGNSATNSGGGAASSTFYNCTLTGNSAGQNGGGAVVCRLYNCTLTGNSAQRGGGAAFVYGEYGPLPCRLYNCLVYFNRAPEGANYLSSYTIFEYSCTTPLPPGPGNIASDPQLASHTHLSPTSACLGAGSPAYASGVDIDGEAWADPPAMGADQPNPSTGPLSVCIEAGFTHVSTGYAVLFTAWNTGRMLKSVWNFGDGTVLTNQPFVSHTWNAPGVYTVRLTGYNDSNPEGVTATVLVTVSEAVAYVDAASPNPVFPYGSWETAATNIQDAVSAGTLPGRLVLVTNGVYRLGTVNTNGLNRVALANLVVVRSVHGPAVTLIEGATNGVRCAYVQNGSVLSGFTLTKGGAVGDWTSGNGAGVWCEPFGVVTNCVMTGNSAESYGGGAYGGSFYNCTLTSNWAGLGGGAAGDGNTLCMLYDCTLTGNSHSGASFCTLYNCKLTGNSGGGAYSCTLYNCVLSGNSADQGGGASSGTLDNCVVAGNVATYSGGGAAGGTLYNCKLTGNRATGTNYSWEGVGGGASDCTLYNCTLAGNSATTSGGGATYSRLNNCIVYFNTAPTGPNYVESEWSRINYSCTTPMPTNGVGNITNAPLFVDYSGGNLRLQSNSPCINAGLNAEAPRMGGLIVYVPGLTDLDGNPRIVSGTIDLGAYEFQGPGSVISYAWLQQYGLPTDGSADTTDSDTDGLNNWQEWRCRTDPTNALFVLRLLSASRAGANVTVRWQSVAGVHYFLERSTNLGATPCFTRLATNLAGQPGTTTYTDTNAATAPRVFYRVGVQ